MNSIKEKSKEWCSEHSNKGCKEQCDGCWQVKQPWGCEQYNMELAYKAGANYVLEKFIDIVNKHTKPNGMEDRAQMAFDMLILIAQLKK